MSHNDESNETDSSSKLEQQLALDRTDGVVVANNPEPLAAFPLDSATLLACDLPPVGTIFTTAKMARDYLKQLAFIKPSLTDMGRGATRAVMFECKRESCQGVIRFQKQKEDRTVLAVQCEQCACAKVACSLRVNDLATKEDWQKQLVRLYWGEMQTPIISTSTYCRTGGPRECISLYTADSCIKVVLSGKQKSDIRGNDKFKLANPEQILARLPKDHFFGGGSPRPVTLPSASVAATEAITTLVVPQVRPASVNVTADAAVVSTSSDVDVAATNDGVVPTAAENHCSSDNQAGCVNSGHGVKASCLSGCKDNSNHKVITCLPCLKAAMVPFSNLHPECLGCGTGVADMVEPCVFECEEHEVGVGQGPSHKVLTCLACLKALCFTRPGGCAKSATVCSEHYTICPICRGIVPEYARLDDNLKAGVGMPVPAPYGFCGKYGSINETEHKRNMTYFMRNGYPQCEKIDGLRAKNTSDMDDINHWVEIDLPKSIEQVVSQPLTEVSGSTGRTSQALSKVIVSWARSVERSLRRCAEADMEIADLEELKPQWIKDWQRKKVYTDEQLERQTSDIFKVQVLSYFNNYMKTDVHEMKKLPTKRELVLRRLTRKWDKWTSKEKTLDQVSPEIRCAVRNGTLEKRMLKEALKCAGLDRERIAKKIAYYKIVTDHVEMATDPTSTEETTTTRHRGDGVLVQVDLSEMEEMIKGAAAIEDDDWSETTGKPDVISAFKERKKRPAADDEVIDLLSTSEEEDGDSYGPYRLPEDDEAYIPGGGRSWVPTSRSPRRTRSRLGHAGASG